MIRFQGKYLRTLVQFQAQSDIRYHLNGILVEPHPQGGVMLVATNGHMLAAIRDTQGTCSERTVFNPDKGAISAAIKRNKLGTPWVDVNPYTNRLSVRARSAMRAGGMQEVEIYAQGGSAVIEGASQYFPEWRNIIPDFSTLKPGAADVLQGNYLRRIIDAHPGNINGSRPVKLWQAEKNGVVIVQFDGSPETMAVIMPMRDELPEISACFGSGFLQPMKAAA